MKNIYLTSDFDKVSKRFFGDIREKNIKEGELKAVLLNHSALSVQSGLVFLLFSCKKLKRAYNNKHRNSWREVFL